LPSSGWTANVDGAVRLTFDVATGAAIEQVSARQRAGLRQIEGVSHDIVSSI
jgi:hypothetical protein